MAFTGFPAAGIDLLQLNRLQNSREFYESHKEEIKRLAIQPFDELIAEMTPAMLEDICRGCAWYPVSACKKNICGK